MARKQLITIRQGLKTNLAASTLALGEMGFCTDTKEVYIGDGTDNILTGRAMSGTEASRPSAGNLGRLYYVTSGNNMGYLYFDTGSIWTKVNAQKITDLSGSLDDVTDGLSYSKVNKADITNGQVNKISDGINTKTAAEIKTHIDDATKHRVINDSGTSSTTLWSSQKTNSEIYNAIRGLEWQDSVKSKTVTTPPSTPVKGDRYIIPAGATGVWSSKTNQIANYNTSWEFFAPQEGWSTYIDAENKNYVFNGTDWVRSGEANQTITAGSGLSGGGMADNITIAVGAGNGIAVGTTTVSAKAGKGIIVNSSGIEANIDADSIIYGTENKLTVGVIDGGTF
nr:DUF2793 domain-containing protein [Sedimentibacter sp.]